MPIEIRELHIRVAVNPEAQHQAPAPASGSAGGEAHLEKDAIVAECVEQVLQIIQSRKER